MSHLQVEQLPPDFVTEMGAYVVTDVAPFLRADPSNYAKGRLSVWLQWEWSLKHKTFSRDSAVQHSALWGMCLEIYPEADLGLITRGPVGIGWHRDDSYADFKAKTLNIGICRWGYEEIYPDVDKWSAEGNKNVTPTWLDLTGGEVITFNCKNRHTAQDLGVNRWSVNLWHVRDKQRHKLVA